MNLLERDEMELADIEQARVCMQAAFCMYGLMDVDFKIKSEWIAEYGDEIGSMDWIILPEGQHLDSIPTHTFLFWLIDKGYIDVPKYIDPGFRARFYIWTWGGHIGEDEKTLTRIIDVLSDQVEILKKELEKLVV